MDSMTRKVLAQRKGDEEDGRASQGRPTNAESRDDSAVDPGQIGIHMRPVGASDDTARTDKEAGGD